MRHDGADIHAYTSYDSCCVAGVGLE